MSLYRCGGKRFMDIALSSTGLLIFALPMIWIAWRISRELRTSFLFRQIRVGYKGRKFLIMKFRTISSSGATPAFCRWLRSTALDELPQLFHILRGQMSFVGPRPIIPEEFSELESIPQCGRRLQVRPGLAGLAQIRGPKVPSLSERLQWDTAYTQDYSFKMDASIIFKALWITFAGAWEPAYPQKRVEVT